MANKIKKEIFEKAYRLICTARSLSDIYEVNKEITSKYVHATSKGHEVIQIALGLQLKEYDWVSPYYRDDSILLSIGMSPFELMLQLMCKKDDPFSCSVLENLKKGNISKSRYLNYLNMLESEDNNYRLS